MAYNLMDVYVQVNTMSDEAVKAQFGVPKKNTLKVLKALLIAELKNESGSAAAAERKPRKPRKAKVEKKTEKKSEKKPEAKANSK